MVQGIYDPRDYRINFSLGFETQARKWLAVKEKEVISKSYANLRNYMNKAIAEWGQMNIKAIGYGEVEDFLHEQNVSDKTKSNMKSGLHSFLRWVGRREKVPMPDFPEMPFELVFRKIIDKATQLSIIDEVHRLIYNWWKKACRNLKIKKVDLYGGTRHSSVYALAELATPEESKNASMHSTNRAFERYYRKNLNEIKRLYIMSSTKISA